MSTSIDGFTHVFRSTRRFWLVGAGAAGAAVLVAGLLALSPARPAARSAASSPHMAHGHSLAVPVRAAGHHGARRGGWGSGASRPSGGPEAVTSHQSGYVASGQPFRYAQAVILVPGRRCASGAGDPRLSVALAGHVTGTSPGTAAASVRAGLLCAPAASQRWQGFVEFSGMPRRAPLLATFPLSGVGAGSSVFTSVSYSATTGTAEAAIVLPSGASFHHSFAVGHLVFTQAQALADWSSASPAEPVPPSAPVLLTRFLSGELVTEAGGRGLFVGPWTAKGGLSWRPWALTADVATKDGGPLSTRTVVSAPSRLWTDGTQGVFGAKGDAFGVWLYP